MEFKDRKIEVLEDSADKLGQNFVKANTQIEEMKLLNTRLVEKCEEFKN